MKKTIVSRSQDCNSLQKSGFIKVSRNLYRQAKLFESTILVQYVER